MIIAIEQVICFFQFPLGRPKCGWKEEFCQNDTWIGENITASIVAIIAVFSIITLSTLTAIQRYSYTYVSNWNRQ